MALLGDRIFYTTDDAHLICLDRLTGALRWDVYMPEAPQHYGATAAPLVIGDLVVAGVAGADDGIRGFLAAYKATTGQLAWRFWTVPRQGDPGWDTWRGNAVEFGGGSTWLTGSYDPELHLLYWPTGNPFPDTDGSERKGDNLYTNCIVALDPDTGKLRWHFQFTPHDLHDWDAVQPAVLVDAQFQGRPRKLLLHADRNGFYYVLDRTNGELLLAKPFARKISWASGIDAKGRPIELPGNVPTPEGTATCPDIRGAANWMSTAYNPATGLYYVMTIENCGTYRSTQFGLNPPPPAANAARRARRRSVQRARRRSAPPLPARHRDAKPATSPGRSNRKSRRPTTGECFPPPAALCFIANPAADSRLSTRRPEARCGTLRPASRRKPRL